MGNHGWHCNQLTCELPEMASKPIVEHIVASVPGRYLLDVPIGSEPDSLLVGFHGYGETAEQNLKELARIPGSGCWLRCSIQALHPFYNRKTNEVVASWMTRLDRERAIRCNGAYVGNVIRKIQLERPVTRRVYLGFSQGVAMAYRAACLTRTACQGLILLGGDCPPELVEIPENPTVLLARGTGDNWYTEAKMEADLGRLETMGLRVRPLIFDGGHEWSPEFLEAAGEFLRGLGSTDAPESLPSGDERPGSKPSQERRP